MKIDLIACLLCLATGLACGAVSGWHAAKRVVVIEAELAGCTVNE